MASTQEADSAKSSGEAQLAELVAEYNEVVHRDIHKDRDCHWQIVERWSYGEHAGWFVEHDGYLYELPGACGETGPYATREEAVTRTIEHLAAAITEVRKFQGG